MALLAVLAAIPPPATTGFTRGFLSTTNQAEAQAYLGLAGGAGTNNSTLTITNYVRMPFTTLTYSGTNASTVDFAAGSAFKMLLTNDVFFGAPSNLPGTNYLQTIQIWFVQDGTGGYAPTFTNGSWVISGSGTSTNGVGGITTNANAISILTFATSPFSATKVAAVTTPLGP